MLAAALLVWLGAGPAAPARTAWQGDQDAAAAAGQPAQPAVPASPNHLPADAAPAERAQDGAGEAAAAGDHSAGQATPAEPHPAERARRDPLADLSPAERARLRTLLDQQDRTAPAAARPAAARPAAIAAKPAAAAATPAKPAPVSLQPDSLAGEVLGQAAALRTLLAAQTASFGHLFADIALSGAWLHRETVDQRARAVLLDAAWRGALLLGAAWIAEWLLLLALHRPLRALARDAQANAEAGEAVVDALASDDAAARPPAVPGLVQAGPPAPEHAAQALAPMPVPGDPLPGSPILPAAVALPAPLSSPPSHPPSHPPGAAEQAELAARSAQHADTRSRDAAHRRRTLRLFRRLPFSLLRLVLKLLPLAAFLAICNLLATAVATLDTTQLVIITIANLYGIGRACWLVADMALAPRAPGVRLLQAGDDTARFLSRWWSWLLAIAVVAVCITDVGRVLDLPPRAAAAIVRAVILVEHLLLALLIWQTRHRVAAALRPPRRLRDRPFGRLLARLAELWWVAALFFDAALWVVWAAQIRGGYAKMWHLFLSTVLIVGACRLLTIMLLGALDRMFRVEGEALDTLPGIERRAARYYPVLRRLVTLALTGVCVLALAWGWGLPVVAFFTHGTLGTRLLSAALTILVAVSVGVVVWELVNGALDGQINRFQDSNQAARAVRLRTLLPILRTLLLVVLGAVLLLTILSEIGVNIAPLLAGAGIIGVALGFGSQKLVQDFITGIFLLVENAMQVGDTVTVAGVTGVVEHLSIRTLRLRGGDGSIQIVPFSSVSTVANMSRDYAVAAVSVSVSFAEDTDRVCEALRAIGAALREDPSFADLILADFALNGVDSLGEYAVAVSGTIRCTVGGRWPVQREFNRRLRARIEELGIQLPRAARTLSMPDLPVMLHAPDDAATAAAAPTEHRP